jgi:hypothetical protein
MHPHSKIIRINPITIQTAEFTRAISIAASLGSALSLNTNLLPNIIISAANINLMELKKINIIPNIHIKIPP